MGISFFFHSLLWLAILLISSLNSLYCPFCPLPVKFSLGFSLPGLSQSYRSAISSGVLKGQGMLLASVLAPGAVCRDAPGLLRIYGERRVEQCLWLIEIVISRATFLCFIHRRVDLLFIGLVFKLTCGFGNCAVCRPPHAQLSSHSPWCSHALYVQETVVVDGGDRGGTGSSFPSFWLSSQSYKSPWHTVPCSATLQPTDWSQPPSQRTHEFPLFVLNSAKAKFLKQNKKCGRLSNPEILELSLLPNSGQYCALYKVSSIMFNSVTTTGKSFQLF